MEGVLSINRHSPVNKNFRIINFTQLYLLAV